MGYRRSPKVILSGQINAVSLIKLSSGAMLLMDLGGKVHSTPVCTNEFMYFWSTQLFSFTPSLSGMPCINTLPFIELLVNHF